MNCALFIELKRVCAAIFINNYELNGSTQIMNDLCACVYRLCSSPSKVKEILIKTGVNDWTRSFTLLLTSLFFPLIENKLSNVHQKNLRKTQKDLKMKPLV